MSTFGLVLRAPGYSLRDVNEWFEGQVLSAERLVLVTSKLKTASLEGDFALPVFVVQGAEDFTSPTSLARAFLESIHAPSKAFVQIEGGGHFAVFMKSDEFLQVLVSKLLPLLRSAGSNNSFKPRSLRGAAQLRRYADWAASHQDRA